jgi:hypothetical protein
VKVALQGPFKTINEHGIPVISRSGSPILAKHENPQRESDQKVLLTMMSTNNTKMSPREGQIIVIPRLNVPPNNSGGAFPTTHVQSANSGDSPLKTSALKHNDGSTTKQSGISTVRVPNLNSQRNPVGMDPSNSNDGMDGQEISDDIFKSAWGNNAQLTTFREQF